MAIHWAEQYEAFVDAVRDGTRLYTLYHSWSEDNVQGHDSNDL